jgi:hypothetical protein
MSAIHYFPRYSQAENVVTNNTLLLLLRLHQYNRFKFEKFLELVCEDEEFQLASCWLQFNQQKGTGKSIVDGFIAQDSIKIAVETKLTEAFDPAQLENHLALFRDEQHKLLILLSPSLGDISKSQLDSVRKGALTKNVRVIHTSFEDIVEKTRSCLSEHEEEMLALVADFESFCSDMELLPRDEYTLFVPPCNNSIETNLRFRLYYCPATWSRRKAKYLGIYAAKSVKAVGQIEKIVSCSVNIDTGNVTVADGLDSLTQDERKRILEATGEVRKRGPDITVGHKFFLCDALQETAFQKKSPGGIRGHRYFDLEKVLRGRVPDDVGDLAALLRERTWE